MPAPHPLRKLTYISCDDRFGPRATFQEAKSAGPVRVTNLTSEVPMCADVGIFSQVAFPSRS